MTLAALLGLPAATSNAALLADAPMQLESPATPEPVPVQRPTDVAAPPATTNEPTPKDAAAPTAEPTATEPVEAPPTTEPPTTQPEPAAVWPAATPPEEAWARPQAPPPPPGTGMRVGGGILIGLGGLDVLAGGLGLAAVSSVEGLIDPATARLVRAISTAQLLLGVVEVGAGIGLVIPGVRRTQRLSAWQSEHRITAPKTGNGMIVGGSILLGLGAFDGLMAGVVASQTGDVPVLNVIVSVGEVAAGAALLGVGLTRKKRYREWERSSFAVPSLSLLPGGAGMSVSGRF